ncbi:hypothetical protein QA645_36435 [Bradyrhizobium sp. CIAT3101]|uniref:hypothetical protein n=1 Tax=Bradyrhizobium sp. CIAT3101 TaxID=439387 RepID=UPI0024B0EADD|nr:hypothetical protein [Bradyrhizobium sp. CIAT3101]WFU79931.1 hypothetical protein QA645_36435 [Bradyrhizobium sp. CIAT3101]
MVISIGWGTGRALPFSRALGLFGSGGIGSTGAIRRRGAWREQALTPESPMLTPYACFARRVNLNSEKSYSIVARLRCMGLFCDFRLSAAGRGPQDDRLRAALTRIQFPGMIARRLPRMVPEDFPAC